PPLTKGMLHPFGIPSAKTDSSPSQAMGHSQVLRKENFFSSAFSVPTSAFTPAHPLPQVVLTSSAFQLKTWWTASTVQSAKLAVTTSAPAARSVSSLTVFVTPKVFIPA